MKRKGIKRKHWQALTAQQLVALRGGLSGEEDEEIEVPPG